MNATRTGKLKVPGATLHYETAGKGPVLLLIPGGAGDAGMYAGMTPRLAAHRTVVTYDPRGLSRSPLDDPADAPHTDEQVRVWSDDAHRLLELLAPDGEAAVLGCSSGAVVAVDLLARRPQRLRRVVTHEPPLVELLAEPAPHRALFAEVRETFQRAGAEAAMARLGEGLTEGTGRQAAERPTELPPGIREMAGRMHANLPVFLGRVLVPFSSTVPDLAALRPVADRLTPAAGQDSRGQAALYGPAVRLAELLGSEFAEFPGGHLGAVEDPEEFAGRLLAVLD
ncbi:alpha/beta hydrolase [Streptomyces sp. ID05-04B]|uniref:alpha/beta fold hydrolase n=1 Tax=unclassified Streptomyces TaxID=2593676 RepID=UPI000D1A9700|nr:MULTISPECIES: alpha/beta hydrolase [unclassified Streptomyces]AVV43960.1 alpha/beta hydrolase [Streptomyces sp. P3]MDX5566239.1 alpha/beta hydrolase [Streptomyces sp. ID05-04B]